ncbi:MAG: hypothetical protein ABMA64_10335, partial [Myxococcota bacterium]
MHPSRTPSRPHVPWALLVVVVAITAMWGAFALYVASDPGRRRRAMNSAGRTWRKVEYAADVGSRPLQVRHRRRTARASQIARELWDAVDDLPFAVCQVAMPRVVRRPYAHGAFMGAAPALLGHPKWRRILAFLMPDVFRDVADAAAKGARTGALIPMFENNPVMAAFGVWRSVEARRGGTAVAWGPDELDSMEWDLFLSSDLVEAWELAAPDARPPVIRSLVDTMVIAHASTTDTVQEQFGMCQWADVRRTPKASLGGVEPGAWLDLFGRALSLAEAPDLGPAIGAMVDEPRKETREECRRHTFADEWSPERVVAVYRGLTERAHLSVVIEIKSLHLRPELLSELVQELNRREVHVAAVGSFVPTDIRGLSAHPQVVRGETLAGPREIVFLHFAGDVQYGCERKSLLPGSSVMFNGASLLVAERAGLRYAYRVDEEVVDELDDYRRRFELEIGLYVQESDCDAEAASLLSELSGRRPETFALGFAWGGVLDVVAFEAGQG